MLPSRMSPVRSARRALVSTAVGEPVAHGRLIGGARALGTVYGVMMGQVYAKCTV